MCGHGSSLLHTRKLVFITQSRRLKNLFEPIRQLHSAGGVPFRASRGMRTFHHDQERQLPHAAQLRGARLVELSKIAHRDAEVLEANPRGGA
jgi:hypothetical protein